MLFGVDLGPGVELGAGVCVGVEVAPVPPVMVTTSRGFKVEQVVKMFGCKPPGEYTFVFVSPQTIMMFAVPEICLAVKFKVPTTPLAEVEGRSLPV